MIPKCGRYVRWHWAHKRRTGCDPWHESETDWHILWKDCFPREFQEIVHYDERTGERHIADVRADNGFIVEVQHSPILEDEMRSREAFYGDMIRIVDARDLHGWFSLGTSFDLATCDPMAYDFRWFGRSTLLKRWSEARKPVYFDTLLRNSLTDHVMTPSREHLLWRLVQFDPGTGLGFIAPVRSDWLVQAVLNGDPVPLMRCEEEDAWRYRRQMREVPFPSTAPLLPRYPIRSHRNPRECVRPWEGRRTRLIGSFKLVDHAHLRSSTRLVAITALSQALGVAMEVALAEADPYPGRRWNS